MKSVLISIQPKWVGKIASGEKTIEVRKTRPKIETPFKCYIYETKGKKVECGFHFEETGRTLRDKYVFGMHEARIVKHYCNEGQGKVIGEFVCDEIFPIRVFKNGTIQDYNWHSMEKSCVSYDDIVNYIGNGITGYGWHISDLKIYDKPKYLKEFKVCKKCCGKKYNYCGKCNGTPITRPPQSWCYVESLGE